MDYLDFVEEYKTKFNEDKQGLGISLFEKVLVTSSRAKDLIEGKAACVENIGNHKPTAVALYEMAHKMIEPEFEEKPQEPLDDELGDDFSD